jgi:hypothetical protein
VPGILTVQEARRVHEAVRLLFSVPEIYPVKKLELVVKSSNFWHLGPLRLAKRRGVIISLRM